MRDRVEWARRAEVTSPREVVEGLLRLVGDVVLLSKDLVADARVPRRDKLVAAAALVYVASPVDIVPVAIPILGQLDDVVVLAYAARRLIAAAGHDVVYELWRGSDEGLALVLNFAGADQ